MNDRIDRGANGCSDERLDSDVIGSSNDRLVCSATVSHGGRDDNVTSGGYVESANDASNMGADEVPIDCTDQASSKGATRASNGGADLTE